MSVRERDAFEDLVLLETDMLESEDIEMMGFSSRGGG